MEGFSMDMLSATGDMAAGASEIIGSRNAEVEEKSPVPPSFCLPSWVILVSFPVFGIVSMIFACMSERYAKAGDYKKAKKYGIIACVINGVALFLIVAGAIAFTVYVVEVGL